MTIAEQSRGSEVRSEVREAVLHRTRLTGVDGATAPATLVNISPSGFMARCDREHAAGDRVMIVLPRLGRVAAQVRWSLGGRIGCQLERPCALSEFYLLLHQLQKV